MIQKIISKFIKIFLLIVISVFVLYFVYEIFDPFITFNMTYRTTYNKVNKIIKKIEKFYEINKIYPDKLDDIGENIEGDSIEYYLYNMDGNMVYVIGFNTIIGTSKGYAYNSEDGKWNRMTE